MVIGNRGRGLYDLTFMLDLQLPSVAHSLHGGALDTHGLDEVALLELLQLFNQQVRIIHIREAKTD